MNYSVKLADFWQDSLNPRQQTSWFTSQVLSGHLWSYDIKCTEKAYPFLYAGKNIDKKRFCFQRSCFLTFNKSEFISSWQVADNFLCKIYKS